MKQKTIQEIADICGGEILSGDSSMSSSVVSTDTRAIEGGEVFFALKGDRFDGGKFAASAVEAGAVAVVVEDPVEVPDSAPVVLVTDVLAALQSLARSERCENAFRVVGITGSSGKTTVKDMITAVLSSSYRVVATKGNLNNHIGLPLSVLSVNEGDEIGVFEMGMNHPGEIAPLAEIAAPDLGVVTSVGTAHIEHMKTRDAIAEEKAALLVALQVDGVGVIPAEDDFVDLLAERCNGRVIRAGVGGDVAVHDVAETADGVSFQLEAAGETVSVTLPYPGHHNAINAALAAAVGLHFEVPLSKIAEALSGVELAGGRLQRRQVGEVIFLDDSYNANPDSMEAALRTLGRLPVEGGGRRVAVIGRMAELGERAAEDHRRLGSVVAESQIDLLYTVGEEPALAWETAPDQQGEAFPDCSAVADHLRAELKPNDLVLLKGSRSSGMEQVLELYPSSPCST